MTLGISSRTSNGKQEQSNRRVGVVKTNTRLLKVTHVMKEKEIGKGDCEDLEDSVNLQKRKSKGTYFFCTFVK